MTRYSQEATLEVPAPVLRIVPTARLLSHEEHDAQRSAPLIERIPESGIWLHPPIVAPLPDSEDYVVLDGANRCHAMAALNYPHTLVQIVTYESGQVTLDTWHHVISDLDPQSALASIRALEYVNVRESDLLTAQAELAQREAVAYMIDIVNGHKTYIISLVELDERNMRSRTDQLRYVVNCYQHRCDLDRINTVDIAQALEMFPDATALVIFPRYEPSEIMVAAREQILLPPGISRHIIQGRAMRLLYPLEKIRDPNKSLEAKNQDLKAWVKEKIKSRAVRFYAESIYTFDD